ncbi:MAG: hypothetical protein KGQ41_07395 [Alphaproteobacteria bacterium]|nr:hypothetical protein [Alphaproteobacteria bacterium]
MTQASAPAFDSGAKQGLPLQVKNKTLLAIMAIVPLAALLAIIDKPLLNGVILSHMITNPRDIAYWTAILTVPHIVASLVTFADGEYLNHHKKRIFKAIIIGILLAFGVPFLTGFVLAVIYDIPLNTFSEYAMQGTLGTLVVMAFYTMYHNLQQQYGISLMMLRQAPTFDYQMWRWFTIIPAGFAYTALMASQAPEIANNWQLIVGIIGGGLFIATVFGLRFVRTILKNPNHTKIGLAFFLANMSLLYVCFGLIVTGYGFMATLVPRLTHDFTAFWVYMVHDQNRNADKIRNPFYFLRKVGVPPALLCPAIAIAISFWLLDTAHNIYLVTLFVTSLNFIHYYMEGYMWKRGEPHRQYVPFV